MKKVVINEEARKERLAVLDRIRENEKLGGENFFSDVELDPPFSTLMPNDVDYNCKKLSTKIKTCIAGIIAKFWSKKVVKDFDIEVVGGENAKAIKGGAVITSNHFSIYENVAVRKVVDVAGRKGNFYKVVREGNFFMPGIIGFLLKYQKTLPLSSNLKTMMNFNKAVDNYLKKGNFVLIYPEKAMWWNYRKPRPFKAGAFHYAVKAGVPILPCFVTMSDMDEVDEAGFKKQKYTIHVMPAIVPDKTLTDKENEKLMMEKNFELCKNKYEEVYKIPLSYDTI